MDLVELVNALISGDALAARAWVAESARRGIQWSLIPQPSHLDSVEMAIAAGVVELLAARQKQSPPAWTSHVTASPRDVFLVRSAEAMPRLRQMCIEQGPEPLRRRHVFAPPDFLTAA